MADSKRTIAIIGLVAMAGVIGVMAWRSLAPGGATRAQGGPAALPEEVAAAANPPPAMLGRGFGSHRGSPSSSQAGREPERESAVAAGAPPGRTHGPGRRPAHHASQAVERDPSSGPGEGGPTQHPASAQGIRDAMRAAQPALRECYEAWLKSNPGLAGTLKVRFSIRAPEDDPEATHATVQDIGVMASDMEQPLFEGCVMNAMQDMRFDVPADGKLDVNYPLRFASPDAGVMDAGG